MKPQVDPHCESQPYGVTDLIEPSSAHSSQEVGAEQVDASRDEPMQKDCPGVADEVPLSFTVQDEQTASWVVRKVIEARAYAERVRAWAERELRRAEHDEAWLLHRFGTDLERFLQSELRRLGGRRRSIALPGGTIGYRASTARLDVVDEAAARQWCVEHLSSALNVTLEAEGRAALELLQRHDSLGGPRVRVRLARGPLKEHFLSTGELPEGMDYQPGSDRFYIK